MNEVKTDQRGDYMDLIKETDLPGIGRKFAIETKDGSNLIIIIHDDGNREIYRFEDEEDDEAEHIVTLDDHEARKIAGILGGMTYTPRALESMKVDLQELTIDWRKMDSDFVCDKTIGELDLRKNVGISIIAVIKADGTSLINPEPDAALCLGDTVVVAGTREQIRNFYKFMKAKD
jgi:TrkA domain protein